MPRKGFVYIMSNEYNTVLYTGATSNLVRRTHEHKTHAVPGSFSDRYNCIKLVWYQIFSCIVDAIDEEKRLKGGSRQQKIDLINNSNPDWKDLWEAIQDL